MKHAAAGGLHLGAAAGADLNAGKWLNANGLAEKEQIVLKL